MTPEELEAQLRADVTSLRRRGYGDEADRIAAVLALLTEGLDPIRLVPEHTAMARSGKRRRWLRDRFDAWARVGAACLGEDGEHLYRLCVLPVQATAYTQGARDAEAVLAAMAS